MSARARRPVPRLALNQEEAADALGVSVDSFTRHIKEELPVVYRGALRLYPVAAIERWLAANETKPCRRT